MTSAISMSSCYSSYASTQTRAADTSKLQQQLFSKVDTNGDKSIDQTELTSFLDYVGEKTGSSIDSASALKALDSDGNGSISETELQDNASALFDQLKSQLMSSQMQMGHGGDGGGMNFEKLLSSLVSQYTAAGSAAASASTRSLSVAA